MERHWHILKPVRSASWPRQVLVFAVDPLVREIERGVHEHTLRCVAVCRVRLVDGMVVDKERREFVQAEAFWSVVASWLDRDTTTWGVCHNLAYALSLLSFWDRLNRGGLHHAWSVLEDQVAVVMVRLGRRSLRLVDLKNYWRVPLRELLGAAGLVGLGTTETNPPLPDALDRARRKVRVTEECVCAMVNSLAKEKLCSLRSTAASTAWLCWRTSYYDSPLAIHAHPEAMRLETGAVFGGQLSLRRTGAVALPVTALDVNSLYPWIMATQGLPSRFVDYTCCVPPRLLRHTVKDFWCVARVTVQPEFPLPWRGPGMEATYHDDVREYTVCGDTLARLADRDLVRGVSELARYAHGGFLARFALDLYARKQAARARSNHAECLLWKMLLNGLSGKFAQRQRIWQEARGKLCPGRWGYWFEVDSKTEAVATYRAVAGSAQRLETGPWTAESFPAVTAAICSAGRLRLQELVEVASRDQVLYTDTDCLHLLQEGRERLAVCGELDEMQLGKLKQIAQGPEAFYWGPKHYRVGEYYVSNVLCHDHREVSDGVYLQESRQGIASVLSGLNQDRVLVKDRTIHINRPRVVTTADPATEENGYAEA